MGSNKLTNKNRLSITNPKLAKEWDYEKNNGLKPENISYGASKKVWWKCKLNHSWAAVINSRNRGKGCPHTLKMYGLSTRRD